MVTYSRYYAVVSTLLILAGYGFGQVTTSRTPSTDLPNVTAVSPSLIKNTGTDVSFVGSLSVKERRKIAQQEELELLNGDTRLLVPAVYKEKFAALLKDEEVNLARIHPNKNCFSGKLVDVSKIEACADGIPLFGDGSYYSFRYKMNMMTPVGPERSIFTHQQADIQFDNGNFVTGSLLVQGLISELVNTDFESLTGKSAEVKILGEYKPKKKLSELQEQQAALKKGLRLDKQVYTDSVPVKPGAVYLLRSIPYHYFHPMIPIYPNASRDLNRRSSRVIVVDTTVAFKIVGQEKDGSLIILWKELKQKNAPVIVFEGPPALLNRL